MSISGTVQEQSQSSTGKPKVKVNGKWYFFDKTVHEFPSTNQAIEFGEGNFQMGDKTMWKITWWKPSGGATGASAAAPSQSTKLDESSLRFISNVVGSAITAGTIKDPLQIEAWFEHAKDAVQGKKRMTQAQLEKVYSRAPIPGVDDRNGYDDDPSGPPF